MRTNYKNLAYCRAEAIELMSIGSPQCLENESVHTYPQGLFEYTEETPILVQCRNRSLPAVRICADHGGVDVDTFYAEIVSKYSRRDLKLLVKLLKMKHPLTDVLVFLYDLKFKRSDIRKSIIYLALDGANLDHVIILDYWDLV